ncbi:alpha/beta hydrolase [Streptomyces sp. NPDC058741]|uniref:alpha/beta hydrolase n=1 Tax=Streptomyces sp. NPDC058741 TaxID=3346620 RepID=UPI0036805B6E
MPAPRQGPRWKGVAVAAAVACALSAATPAAAEAPGGRTAPAPVPTPACAPARTHRATPARPSRSRSTTCVPAGAGSDWPSSSGRRPPLTAGAVRCSSTPAALPGAYELLPRELRERFDVVSGDPRGVRRSTAVRCYRSADEFTARAARVPDGFPVGSREREDWISAFAELGRLCEQRVPGRLGHASTADTARDLDLLRRAGGDRKPTYLGVSHGTFLGATYADLFPHRVRAMVLHGNVDPVRWVRTRPRLPTELRQGADVGSARTLSRFLALRGGTTADRRASSAGTPRATRDKYQPAAAPA